MIQTVIFDLGGVLIEDPSAGMTRYYANYLQINRESLLEALNKLWDAWHKGSLSEQEVWEQVTTDLKIQNAIFDSLWIDGFKQTYQEKPEMFVLLKQLKRQGYTTALLSNTEAPVVSYLKQRPYEDIDQRFYSCEMGMRKPEKGIYEKTLQGLACQPEAAVFIDDRRENVDAATSLGIPSILFRNCDDLKEQLSRYRISL